MEYEDEEDEQAMVAVERADTYPVRVGDEVLYSRSARLDRILIKALPGGESIAAGIDYKIGNKRPDTEQVLINLAVLKQMYPGHGAYQCWLEALTDYGMERTVYHTKAIHGMIRSLNDRVHR